MQADLSGDQSMHVELRQVAQRLGITGGEVHQARLKSDAINEICADFEECCAKVRGLEQAGEATGQPARDYRELRDQLRRELERQLARVVSTAAGEQSGQADRAIPHPEES